MNDDEVIKTVVGGFGGLLALFSSIALYSQRRARRLAHQRALEMPTTPLALEQHCAALLNEGGWKAKTTVATGDQGVDVIARKGAVTLVLQCKLYSKPVGNKAVQEIIAGRHFAGATHAAVVSNQTYTPSARALAARTGVLLLEPADLKRADRLFK